MANQIAAPANIAYTADAFDEDGERLFQYRAHATPSGRTTAAAVGQQHRDGRMAQLAIIVDHRDIHGQTQDLCIESIDEAENLIDVLRAAIGDAFKAAITP